MDKDQARSNYAIFGTEYLALQEEVLTLASALVKENERAIHVADLRSRPERKIKKLESILENIDNPDKYVAYKSFFDIKDISGIRITCHCEDDVENLATLLEGELRQKYSNVVREDKGGEKNVGKSKPPYRAVHLTFSKKIKKDIKSVELYCEIQIRTVMADAWAIQDRKYVYGKAVEGDAQELTNAVSEIMKGCEKLWSLVKTKSSSENKKQVMETIEAIKKRASASLGSTKTLENDQGLKKWFIHNNSIASAGFNKLDIKTFLEVKIIPPDIGLNVSKTELKDKARSSTIRTFGWPIGIFLENRKEFAPKVNPTGIHAEISIKEPDWGGKERISYDYWAINSNGAFYLLKSLFENERNSDSIFFNTRIVRITEIILYISNLYTALDVPLNAKILMNIKHSGLHGKKLASSSPNRMIWDGYVIDTDKVENTVEFTLSEVESNLVDIVEKFTEPLFEQFDFFKLDHHVLSDIVLNFKNGKVV